MQHEFREGTVLSIDYVRNVSTHTLLAKDVNHVGDARFLNVNNAVAAINNAIAANPSTAGICTSATGAGASSQSAVNCYLANVPSATIVDFASQGLDSGNFFCGGGPGPN